MPKYVIGCCLLVIVIFASIAITIVGGSTYMSQIPPTELAKEKVKIWGHSGWSFNDPWMTGDHAPTLAGKGEGHLHPRGVLVVPHPCCPSRPRTGPTSGSRRSPATSRGSLRACSDPTARRPTCCTSPAATG